MELLKEEKQLLMKLHECGIMRSNVFKKFEGISNYLIDDNLIIKCIALDVNGYFIISKTILNSLMEILKAGDDFPKTVKCAFFPIPHDNKKFAREICAKNKSKTEIEIDKFYAGYDKQWKRYMEATDESELNRIWNILEKQLDKFMR